MNDTTKTPTDLLAEVEAELLAWSDPTRGKSHWNELHGSVTGDYYGMFERTARADAAEIEKLTRSVEALRLLAQSTGSRRTLTLDIDTGEWLTPGASIQGEDGARLASSVLPGMPPEVIEAAYAAWMEETR